MIVSSPPTPHLSISSHLVTSSPLHLLPLPHRLPHHRPFHPLRNLHQLPKHPPILRRVPLHAPIRGINNLLILPPPRRRPHQPINGVINIVTKSSRDTQGLFLEAGAGSFERGYISKGDGEAALFDAMRAVLAGDVAFSPEARRTAGL